MGIMHRILVVLGFLGAGVWTIFMASPLILFGRFFPVIGPWIHRAWGWGCCRCLGIHIIPVHLDRIPKDLAVVFAPNHESMCDIIVMASLPIRYRWISKEQVGRVPFIGAAMRTLGAYFVKRDRSPGDLHVMQAVEDGLRQGHSVMIFPEGTRTKTGQLQPFKKGAFKTSQNAGIPLLPVALNGTFGIAPRGGLPLRWGHKVVVLFGQPILPMADLTAMMDRYRDLLTEAIVEARSHRNSVL